VLGVEVDDDRQSGWRALGGYHGEQEKEGEALPRGRRLHARRVERRWRLVGSAGVRWRAADRATAAWVRSRGHARNGTHGRGPA
jgi:hypothetical protein